MRCKQSCDPDRPLARPFLDIVPAPIPHCADLNSSRISIMPAWAIQANSVLATVVVSVGAWLVWGSLPIVWTVALAGGILLFLLRQGTTIGKIWAWSTFLLGIESLAWPVITMVRLRTSSSQPSDEEMGLVLNAVLFGLFSSVFWISFAFGLFKREQRAEPISQDDRPPSIKDKRRPRRKAGRS